MKTTLSIEESVRLVELGVDAKLASKCWISSPSNREEKVLAEYDPFFYEFLVNPEPVFTLTDIFSILPKGIIHEGLSCKFRITSWYDEPYFAGYEKQVDGYVCIFDAPELIDALNSLLIWCLTENKINLNTEKE